jgi:hypothetical protein
MIPHTTADVLTEMKWGAAENDLDKGWERFESSRAEFRDRIRVGRLREETPKRLGVPKSAKFDLLSSPWRSS